jgi:archaeosine-15-forming tRNA-guanine transglycosylase
MNYKVTAREALKQLLEQNEFPFTVMMKHGSMTIEYFAPQEVDTQTHISRMRSILSSKGHSSFYRNGERVSCKKK